MNAAGRKWLQLFVDILTYEFDHAGDGQLLSDAADRLILRFPVAGRLFILSAGAVITIHLANAIDERYDVMAQSFWKPIIKGR